MIKIKSLTDQRFLKTVLLWYRHVHKLVVTQQRCNYYERVTVLSVLVKCYFIRYYIIV
jgi:hypothetical protein